MPQKLSLAAFEKEKVNTESSKIAINNGSKDSAWGPHNVEGGERRAASLRRGRAAPGWPGATTRACPTAAASPAWTGARAA